MALAGGRGEYAGEPHMQETFCLRVRRPWWPHRTGWDPWKALLSAVPLGYTGKRCSTASWCVGQWLDVRQDRLWIKEPARLINDQSYNYFLHGHGPGLHSTYFALFSLGWSFDFEQNMNQCPQGKRLAWPKTTLSVVPWYVVYIISFYCSVCPEIVAQEWMQATFWQAV